MILETGYVSPVEALAIVREASKQGIQHLVVSHAATGTSTLSIPQMKEAIGLGAYLEFAGVSVLGPRPEKQPTDYAEMIREVGVDHVIMGSDFGQPDRPLPPDGLALYASLMRKQGFTESAQISGDVVPVSDGVPLNGAYLPVTISESGVLLYAAGGSAGGLTQLGWFDRTGKSLGPVGVPGNVLYPAISPDEKSVAFSRASSGGADLWVRDLSRGTETRFTSDASNNISPFWSPKGDHIVFASNRTGVYNLYQRATGGSGQDEPLLPISLSSAPNQWSRDGRFIVYHEFHPKTKNDLWILPTEGAAPERKSIPFLRTEANDLQGQLSPDSHWMAFTSDRSGKREVYVRPFPASEGEWTISLAGGQAPRWSGDGKELFFEAADGKMMAVAVKAVTGPKPSFEAGAPVPLFDAHIVHPNIDVNMEYDVTADGKRFLINTVAGSGGGPGAASPPLTVVTNWTAGLKK